MKTLRDTMKTMPLIGAIALGIVAIFYLSDDGMSTQGPIAVSGALAAER